MRLGRPARILLIVVAASVLSAVAGMTASLWVKSPQQLAAEASPPARTALSAPVEHRVLHQAVVIRGDVAPARSFQVTPAPKDGERAVVTAVKVRAGGTVKPGAVLVEVAGRPLVALPGGKPAYRDLRPGYDGPDVKQLRAALTSLGFSSHDPAGYFGAGTKRALERFYRSIGYPVTPTGADDAKQLEAADRAVIAAQRAVEDAANPVGRTRAREDLKAAQQDRAALQVSTGPMLPLSEYVFLPSFPARVEQLKAEVGGEVQTPLIKLSSGRLRINGQLSAASRAAVKPGMSVEIASETFGITVAGTVTSIGDLQADKATGLTGYPIVVTPRKPLDPKLAGQDVRLTIATAATPGPVLVVPVSALFTTADGSVKVIRLRPDGTQEPVQVKPGMNGDGYVEVTGPLDADDRLLIGVQAP